MRRLTKLGLAAQYYTARFPGTESDAIKASAAQRNQLRILATMMRVTMLQSKRAPTDDTLVPLLPLLQAGLSCGCARVRLHTTEAWLAAFTVMGHRCGGVLCALIAATCAPMMVASARPTID